MMQYEKFKVQMYRFVPMNIENASIVGSSMVQRALPAQRPTVCKAGCTKQPDDEWRLDGESASKSTDPSTRPCDEYGKKVYPERAVPEGVIPVHLK
jgi:hypothetical protein